MSIFIGKNNCANGMKKMPIHILAVLVISFSGTTVFNSKKKQVFEIWTFENALMRNWRTYSCSYLKNHIDTVYASHSFNDSTDMDYYLASKQNLVCVVEMGQDDVCAAFIQLNDVYPRGDGDGACRVLDISFGDLEEH